MDDIAVHIIAIAVVSVVLVAIIIYLFVNNHKHRLALEAAKKAAIKRTEELSQQTELARKAAEAKSDFLSRMSHEIRTPLNAIIGMTHIAQNTKSPAQLRDSLEKVDLNSKHLLAIINNVLDFSKLESGKMELASEWFSLSADIGFVMDMFSEAAAEKGLDLNCEIRNLKHDGLLSDSLRLNQILINLLSNAMKFTEQGEIRVTVEELFFLNGEAVYQFSVSDTGIGIEPSQTANLFTPFTQAGSNTTKLFGGTGLGLPIANNLVAMFGGDIEIDTRPGQGSTLSFTIRTRAKESAETTEPAAVTMPNTINLRGKNIMVVDDIEVNHEIISALLEDTGARIIVAEHGRRAVELFAASEEGHFDLILMDLQMPVMDGYAAAEEIRQLRRSDAKAVTIAAMSASITHEYVEQAARSGMNGFIGKPIDIDKLYLKLGEWL